MEENAVGVTSQANRSTLAAILLSVSAGLSLVVTSIIIFKPYFGNMDDSAFMELAGQAPFWVFHGFGELSLGFARHASWIFMWPQYTLSNQNLDPATLYVLNAIVVFAGVLIFLLAARSYFDWRAWQSYVAFFGAFLAWPYFSEIFVFPS